MSLFNMAYAILVAVWHMLIAYIRYYPYCSSVGVSLQVSTLIFNHEMSLLVWVYVIHALFKFAVQFKFIGNLMFAYYACCTPYDIHLYFLYVKYTDYTKIV